MLIGNSQATGPTPHGEPTTRLQPAMSHYIPRPEHRAIVVVDITASVGGATSINCGGRAQLNRTYRVRHLRHYWITGVRGRSRRRHDRNGLRCLCAEQIFSTDAPTLATALNHHNAMVDSDHRIRVRVSMHAGEVHHDATGWLAPRSRCGRPPQRPGRLPPSAAITAGRLGYDHLRCHLARRSPTRLPPRRSGAYTPYPYRGLGSRHVRRDAHPLVLLRQI
jgi:hypothetical protein